jgi:hypothetical protein
MSMRSFLLVGASVVSLAWAPARAEELKAGDLVIFECLGDYAEKDGTRFLNGRTVNGAVDLAARTGGEFTGTKWKVVQLDSGILGFECQGSKPGNRWLDGRTHDATVGLAAKTGGKFTGTRWKVHDRGGRIQLECQGDTEGPRWLDGVTGKAAVQLTRNNKRSGTFWKVKKIE